MAWRSVVIAHPAALALKQNALQVQQQTGTALVPLEDIAALVLDHPQITLSAPLLAACAEAGIAVLTVGHNHHPNGVLLPFLPHSRALKVMQAQLSLSQPRRKQLWQHIVCQKIANQGQVLMQMGERAAQHLLALIALVRSGDPDNVEGQAAQIYFRALFNPHFGRKQSRFHNAALNYAYAVLRAALARSLVLHGFLPAFGLHHHSEQNAFNLADDLIEPYRQYADTLVVRHYPQEPERELLPEDKGKLVRVLHEEVALSSKAEASLSRCTVLAAIEATVISLQQIVLQHGESHQLVLPVIEAN